MFIALAFAACNGGAAKGDKGAASKDAAAAGSQDSKTAANDGTAKSAGVANAPIDTAKLQQDMNTILTGMISGKPDTAALKKAAADFGMTTQQMLSDSGINALYGNSNDPSVRAAGDMLKKLRDATGLTPDKLDSLKKATDLLNAN